MPSRTTAPLVLVAGATLLVACDSTPKERLEGHWVGESVESFHPADADKALGWAKGTHITFKGSRVTVRIPAESPRSGTFKLAEATEEDLRIKFMRPTGAVDEATFHLEGDDGLRWNLGSGRSILMRKVAD